MTIRALIICGPQALRQTRFATRPARGGLTTKTATGGALQVESRMTFRALIPRGPLGLSTTRLASGARDRRGTVEGTALKRRPVPEFVTGMTACTLVRRGPLNLGPAGLTGSRAGRTRQGNNRHRARFLDCIVASKILTIVVDHIRARASQIYNRARYMHCMG